DGALVVGDDDELGLRQEPLQDADEAVDVRFVQRRVQFVQHAEGAGFDLVNGEQQSDCRHGLFAAGKQGDALQLFARRTGHDVDATFEHVTFVHQNEVGFAPAENLHEHQTEVVADAVEGLGEHLLGLRVNAADDLHQLDLRLGQVLALRGQELMALFGFFVFLDRDQVDRPDFVKPPLQTYDLFGDDVPIG